MATGSVSEHPTDDELLAYCESPDLNWDMVELIEAHLIDCGECCRKVVAIVRGMPSKQIY